MARQCLSNRAQKDISERFEIENLLNGVAKLPSATHCLIRGFATEYNKSVKKLTAMYVKPIARMQPCTR